MKAFSSDNCSGIHPAVLAAIANVNAGHARSYGYDETTAAAEALFRREFGDNIGVFFVLTGTAANVLGIKALTKAHDAVICAEESHLNSDECGAPERIACKLIPAATHQGKLRPADLDACFLHRDEHRVRPKVISISQTTEWGTVYTPAEIRALSDYAHGRDCFLHVDGARLANAAVAANASLKDITAGVDVLSFGGTKNGIMCGEAVIFFGQRLAADFKFVRKQGMQLASKMRFVSAQFVALLTDELWKKNAAHSNAMARLLAGSLGGNPRVKLMAPVEANAVFAQVPADSIEKIRKHFLFHVWDEHESIVRWMTTFDTTLEEVRAFADVIKANT